MADDPLRMMQNEFDLWGVKFEHSFRGSGHIELRWQVAPEKPVRSHIIAKTPSDFRWFLNERARVRQLFRADGLQLRQQVAKKPKPLEKALSLPGPVETTPDQIRMLRAEVSFLTELVVKIKRQMEAMVTAAAAPKPEPIAVSIATPMEAAPKRKTYTVKIMDHVSVSWNTIEAIADSADVPRFVAKRKLDYCLQKGLVEGNGHRWRRKPALKKANGNHHRAARAERRLSS